MTSMVEWSACERLVVTICEARWVYKGNTSQESEGEGEGEGEKISWTRSENKASKLEGAIVQRDPDT